MSIYSSVSEVAGYGIDDQGLIPTWDTVFTFRRRIQTWTYGAKKGTVVKVVKAVLPDKFFRRRTIKRKVGNVTIRPTARPLL